MVPSERVFSSYLGRPSVSGTSSLGEACLAEPLVTFRSFVKLCFTKHFKILAPIFPIDIGQIRVTLIMWEALTMQSHACP